MKHNTAQRIDTNVLEYLDDYDLKGFTGKEHISGFKLLLSSTFEQVLPLLGYTYNQDNKKWLGKPGEHQCTFIEATHYVKTNACWLGKPGVRGFAPIVFILVEVDKSIHVAQVVREPDPDKKNETQLTLRLRAPDYSLGTKGWDPKWISIYFFKAK